MTLDAKSVVANLSSLRETKWYEYAVRFLFGGVITVIAGLVAKKYGPATGGLFLAFPAIFPASATLIETHERKRKTQVGGHGEHLARQAVGADSAGAAMGSIGLLGFAITAWQLLPEVSAPVAIITATFIWALISALIWIAWKRNWFRQLRTRTRLHDGQHTT